MNHKWPTKLVTPKEHRIRFFLLVFLTLGVSLWPLEAKDVRIWVYFSPTTNLSSYLVQMINQAKRSIDAAFYNIEDTYVVNAFIAAKDRGVTIRLVTDNDNYSNPAIQKLLDAGIPVMNDIGDTDLMHNKFCIVDSRYLWTGSYNPTSNDLVNDNNAIKIDSVQLCENYLNEFNELFSGTFGGGSKTQNTKVYVGDTLVESYFAPEDDVKSKILDRLNKAKSSIHFAIFCFSDEAYSKALIKRFQKGIIVEGIVDNTASAGKKAVSDMYHSGIKVICSHPLGYSMHHKFIIIDMEILITGSFNLSQAANKENDENILIIHNPGIARTYYAEFKRLYGQNSQAKDKKEEISYIYTKPNPAENKTTITYNLSLDANQVRIRIFDVAGNQVKTIDDAPHFPGHNEFNWDLTNDYGRDLSNGIYIIQVEAEIDGRIVSGFGKVAILR